MIRTNHQFGEVNESHISVLLLLFFNALSTPFLYLKKSGIDKSAEWSTTPACPSLMCFVYRGNTEGTVSSKKKMFDVCVCFLYISVRTDLVVFR